LVDEDDFSMRCPNCYGMEFEIPTSTRLEDKAQCVDCNRVYFVGELASAQSRLIGRELLEQSTKALSRKPEP
jgi:hypothetical protein